MIAANGDLIIRRLSWSDSDSEGRATESVVTQTVKASVDQLSAVESERAARRGEDATIVARVPLLTDVAAGDEIEVGGYDDHLNGTYRVVSVRRTTFHLRLLADVYNPDSP